MATRKASAGAADSSMAMNDTQMAIVRWMADDHTGRSSTTMAYWLGFGIKIKDRGHPRDAYDFLRCMRLLFRAPDLRHRLKSMGTLSKSWRALVGRWDEIEATILVEMGRSCVSGEWPWDGRAPQASKMIGDELEKVGSW